MDIVAQQKENLNQLKQMKEFLLDLNPTDWELRSFLTSIDQKINKAEVQESVFTRTVEAHRCGLCDRRYDEDEPKAVGNLKICPLCREQCTKMKVGSEWERIYNLPTGTIKRDCTSKNGSPAKLQAFIDCGLIDTSGLHYYVHEKVIEMYYLNEEVYKTRARRNS